MVTKDMLGLQFKCRVTPYTYAYQYDSYGTMYWAISEVNGVGQIYEEPERTVLGDKCLVVLGTATARITDSPFPVAFDAICVLTHLAVAVKGHPLDATELPVVMVMEVLDSGIAAQDGRFAVVSNDVSTYGWLIYESKNASDLVAWGSPKARVRGAPLHESAPRFTGSEHYFGPIPEILDSSLALTGTGADVNTHLAANFVDFSYAFVYDVFVRVVHQEALTADVDYLAGVTYRQFVNSCSVIYGVYSALPSSGIQNSYGHRQSVKTFMGSNYVSTATPVSDYYGALSASDVQTSLYRTNYSMSTSHADIYFSYTTGGSTKTDALYVSGWRDGGKDLTSTVVCGNDGSLVSIDVVPNDPGDPEILEIQKRCFLVHALS